MASARIKATSEGAHSPTITEEPRDRGRPTLYTRGISDEICKRLALGETLNQICRSEHMPSRPTVVSWAIEDRDGFSDRYAAARDRCLEAWADEILEIGDDGTNDWMAREGKDGEGTAYAINGEHTQRSRLRIDSRKWLLSKLKPEKYGDKVQHVGGGSTDAPIKHDIAFVIVDPAQPKD